MNVSRELHSKLDLLGREFLARVLEVETRRHPENVEALAELGQVYTQLGQWELGLTVDRKLVRLVPDNYTAHYNLACSLALLERADAALEALERAVALGYTDADFLASDPDLASLHQEARFRALLRRLRASQTA